MQETKLNLNIDTSNFYMEQQKKELIEKLATNLKRRCRKIKDEIHQLKNTTLDFTYEDIPIKIIILDTTASILIDNELKELIDNIDTLTLKMENLLQKDCQIYYTIDGYIIPDNFFFEDGNIYTIVEKNDRVGGKWVKRFEKIKILDRYIFIISDVYSKEYQTYQYEILCVDKLGNRKVEICNKDTLCKASNIVSFLSNRLSCDCLDEYKNHYNKFFFEFMQLNKNILEKKETLPTLGWNKNFTEFVPYSKKLYVDYSKDTHGFFRNMVKGFETCGDRMEFLARLRTHAKNKHADFAISAAFAAPLLKVVGVRSFLINLYGNSKNQKSLSARIGLAAFGDIKLLEMNGQDTVNVLKGKIHKLQNNICLIDDIIQKGKNKTGAIINGYDVGNERDRHRMDQHAEIKATKSWRTIALCTSELPIQDTSDMAGEINRTLSINVDCRPKHLFEEKNDIEFDFYAQEYYRFLDKNHGLLGNEYIEKIINLLKKNPDFLNKIYDKIYKFLAYETNDINLTDHIASVSAVVLGNYLYRYLLLQEDNLSYSLNLGKYILTENLQSKQELDVETQVMNDIREFYEINKISFINEDEPNYKITSNNIFGKIKNNEIYFILGPLKEYLISKDWSWGIIATLKNSGRINYASKRINNIPGKRIIIPLKDDGLESEVYLNTERKGIENENEYKKIFKLREDA